ncbi:MBOAT family O-acyltransferase [Gilliamella apicola]|uniref:MBOAT family O-acyltransferase n=2 Tax=Gilliamella apicola TaxID=1196095 RepID=UPI00080EAB53|nr:MBOAT family O-acyltransferase [Gilliamella apicola]OCG13449.1 poly(beta-D-mannuronate) O-acetylase [Gilliamella apicola]ORF44433.1 membrane-bound O-acyltransferase family protein [Gilliamella apicola]ORF48372.1 membrane-bound O-acyltransferase family protein [Gilliamella apicola]ORF53608.1 membrane-bound O-acyltransferase family protein [Gilliamella apicola]ORF55329.1 membrane-bound O-acyltransferase family protein [Gilliamella apicola]
MSYLSIEFGLTFIVFFALYWRYRLFPKLQNKLLLVSSYLIVASFSLQFALILFIYTCVIYFFSIMIAQSDENDNRWLIWALCLSITNLSLFKYFDFFRYELQALFNFLHIPIALPVVTVLIPIGISFYTLHSVSYIVSVKKSELPVAKFWDFALFLSFFPSVIAGPVNRAKDFLPQITTRHPRKILQPFRAFTLIILSVIKVYCLGGIISENWVTPIFANPLEFSIIDLLVGLYGYSIQIYLNFSGYTDLVTGMALLLGFRLPTNFNFPYLACNLREFWSRWHISLSHWIRDYIYIPLGGNRKGFVRTQINVMLAMLLSGLWHGAGINFIIWGACHGFGIMMLNISERYFGRGWITERSPTLARFLTWHYVCFSWLFFNCESLPDALDYLTALTHNFLIEPKYTVTLLSIYLVFFIYPILKNIPDWFTLLISRINLIYLPIIFISVLWLTIYIAPSGVPNFIYANF